MKKIFNSLLGLVIGLSPLLAQSQFVNYSTNDVSNISEEYTVENLKTLNSKHLDYSAIPYQNGIVFTSTRGNGGALSCNNNFDGGNYSDLYYAEMDANGAYQSPEPMRGKMNGKYHDGVVTFDPTGKRMYFSRNNNEGTNEAGTKHLKIYAADYVKGTWQNFTEVSFNNQDFATCHPSLTEDGNTMYFASNIPGGHGGMDIYKTTKSGETWSAPINLGPTINSAGNEIFPHISNDGTLFYSSNGQAGLGGLDIFAAKPNGNSWQSPTPMPSPINSEWDDFGYSTFAGGRKGFLTSNRKGGEGKDDLYQWVYTGTPATIANICVIDAVSKSRINDAQLVIGTGGSTLPTNPTLGDALQLTSIFVDGKKYLVFKDDANNNRPNNGFQPNQSCDFSLPVQAGKYYQINVEKPGYKPVKLNVSANELTANPEYLVPLTKMKLRKNIVGIVKNNKNNTPLFAAFVRISNTCTNEVYDLKTDENGAFSLDIDCQCDYEMVGSQQNFKDGKTNLSVLNFGCDNLPDVVEIGLTPKEKPKPIAPSIVSDEEKMYSGKVIRLDKLFYDFDKANIRPDAAIELDKVVNLLKQYPSMTIEMGSHTDSRGSETYNRDLSQRRADSAIEYIISKGIKSSRLSANGYGETALVNNCKNGVDCSDEEHQLNRRTEIKVVNFDEKEVKVID